MDILSVDQISDSELDRIFERADHWFDSNRSGAAAASRPLDGRTAINLFYENSTRTLMSFAIAAGRLGAFVVSLPVEASSVKKGETLEDTARTLDAMRPDVLVIRHSRNGAPATVADMLDCPVINAGDGTNEHPTQALLDAATIRRRFGRIEGLKVAICGDIKHSRVAHSNARLLQRLGAEVRLAGPPQLLPADLAEAMSVDEAIAGAEVVMMLRVQRERLEEDIALPDDYLGRFGLTAERLRSAAPTAAVMHPGPMNRGIEIDSVVADDPERSLIWLQVEMGVAVRMACLERVTAAD